MLLNVLPVLRGAFVLDVYFSGGILSGGANVRGAIVLGGNCPGGQLSGHRTFSQGEIKELQVTKRSFFCG